MKCNLSETVTIECGTIRGQLGLLCLSSLDWIQALPNWVMVGATLALAYYAYVTIEEGKKNRRKDTIEKKLERLYSPLYEIMWRARHEKSPEREWVRKPGGDSLSRDWAFLETEFEKVRSIFGRYGHYLEADGLSKLVIDFDSSKREQCDTVPCNRPLPAMPSTTEQILYYRFANSLLDPYFEKIIRQREDFRKDLQELTK